MSRRRGRDPSPAVAEPAPVVVAPLPAHPTDSLPPALRTLRRSYELASVSQFIGLFGTGIGIKDFDVERLEADLIGDPGCCIPHIAAKLLSILTGDRALTTAVWESRLRREYLKRDPLHTPLGYEPLKAIRKSGPKRQVGYAVVDEETGEPYDDDANDDVNTPGGGAVGGDGPPVHSSVALLRSETMESSSARGGTRTPAGSETPGPETDQEADTADPTKLAIPWSSISALKKLRCLHQLCEWQFSSAADIEKFRRAVEGRQGVPPDPAAWRMEPCGWDAKGNSYWFIGDGKADTRLWINRLPPKPARASPKKKQRGDEEAASPSKGKKKAAQKAAPAKAKGKGKKRAREEDEEEEEDSEDEAPATGRKGRGGRGARTSFGGPAKAPPTTASGRPARAAAVAASKAKPSPYSIKRPRIFGTRTSSRRSGGAQDYEWQEMPPEWFDDPANAEEVARAIAEEAEEKEREEERRRMEEEGWLADPEALLKGLATKKKKGRKSQLSVVEDFEPESDVAAEPESEVASDPVPPRSTSSRAPPSRSKRSSIAKAPPSPSRGTRSTRRTRFGADDEDGWEQVPEEWLREPEAATGAEESSPIANVGSGAQEDEEEDAMEVEEAEADEVTRPSAQPIANEPEEEEDKMDVDADAKEDAKAVAREDEDAAVAKVEVDAKAEADAEAEAAEAEEAEAEDEEEANPELKGHPLDPEWIEWEAICCQLSDWQAFALTLHSVGSRDKGQRHERDLHAFVTEEVIPSMEEEVKNREKARKMEEAVSMRKRSSRIAVKELENEQAAKVAAEAEAERELRARAARAEARQRAEDERREREEEKRLARIAEREERAAQREAQIAYEKEQERKRQERRRLRAEGRAIRVATREAENSVHATTGEEEDWELDCRICGVVGKNMNDGSDIICCDQCGKWSHLACQVRADEILKRPKTDWSKADFVCLACSGQPVPRALNVLRTHINGKPKPPPKPKKPKPPPTLVQTGPASAGQAQQPRPPVHQAHVGQAQPRVPALGHTPNGVAAQSPYSTAGVYAPPRSGYNVTQAAQQARLPPAHAPPGQPARPQVAPEILALFEPYYNNIPELWNRLRSSPHGAQALWAFPFPVQNALRNVARAKAESAAQGPQAPVPVRAPPAPTPQPQASAPAHPAVPAPRPAAVNGAAPPDNSTQLHSPLSVSGTVTSPPSAPLTAPRPVGSSPGPSAPAPPPSIVQQSQQPPQSSLPPQSPQRSPQPPSVFAQSAPSSGSPQLQPVLPPAKPHVTSVSPTPAVPPATSPATDHAPVVNGHVLAPAPSVERVETSRTAGGPAQGPPA